MHLHFQFVHFRFWLCSSLADKRGIDMRIKGKGGEHAQSRSRMVWGEVVTLDTANGIWIHGNYVHVCELKIETPEYL